MSNLKSISQKAFCERKLRERNTLTCPNYQHHSVVAHLPAIVFHLQYQRVLSCSRWFYFLLWFADLASIPKTKPLLGLEAGHARLSVARQRHRSQRRPSRPRSGTTERSEMDEAFAEFSGETITQPVEVRELVKEELVKEELELANTQVKVQRPQKTTA